MDLFYLQKGGVKKMESAGSEKLKMGVITMKFPIILIYIEVPSPPLPFICNVFQD